MIDIDPENPPQIVKDWLTAVGRLGAARRERVESTCATCGRPIVGLKTKRYCDGRCRGRAKRRRGPAG